MASTTITVVTLTVPRSHSQFNISTQCPETESDPEFTLDESPQNLGASGTVFRASYSGGSRAENARPGQAGKTCPSASIHSLVIHDHNSGENTITLSENIRPRLWRAQNCLTRRDLMSTGLKLARNIRLACSIRSHYRGY